MCCGYTGSKYLQNDTQLITKVKIVSYCREACKHYLKQMINDKLTSNWKKIFFILWLHLWHINIPRLGVESELQLPTDATATGSWDLRHICCLKCSLWQHWILNPMSKARVQACILMDTNQVCNLLNQKGNSKEHKFLMQLCYF